MIDQVGIHGELQVHGQEQAKTLLMFGTYMNDAQDDVVDDGMSDSLHREASFSYGDIHPTRIPVSQLLNCSHLICESKYACRAR